MARKTTTTPAEKPAPPDNDIQDALAFAVATGDIVAFRQMFGPVSPLRAHNSEDLYAGKYDYMRPNDDARRDPYFQMARELAGEPGVWQHTAQQFTRKGPAQLPSELVLMLADNALRLEKYGSAAQAYEMLRVRPRMQRVFYEEGDAALDQDDLPRAVRAYRMGVGLAYDYTAFPEPLPAVPNYQTRALMLHAHYPTRPEMCVAMLDPETFLGAALSYLLNEAEATERLSKRDAATQAAFAEAWIRAADPGWDAFAERYREASETLNRYGERLQRLANKREGVEESLADELAAEEEDFEPRKIPARLLGREIEGGEWWQYLKELAFEHPAAVLFLARNTIGGGHEIIQPRLRTDSPLAGPLGLMPATAAQPPMAG